MKNIILSSPKFTGEINLVYKSTGYLGKMDLMQAEITIEQLNHFVRELLPYHIEDIKHLPKRFVVKESDFEIDFEADFWKKYRKKVNKDRCTPLWAKLKKMDQLQACIGLKEYFECCDRTGRKIADPETYLRAAYWKNDWKTV